jgi:hypothetical protein
MNKAHFVVQGFYLASFVRVCLRLSLFARLCPFRIKNSICSLVLRYRFASPSLHVRCRAKPERRNSEHGTKKIQQWYEGGLGKEGIAREAQGLRAGLMLLLLHAAKDPAVT